jgi:hypothetical protein
MYRIDGNFGLSKINQEHFYGKGEIVCKCCNGTGINLEYKEVNRILAAIDGLSQNYGQSFRGLFNRANTSVPYCLSCYGMKKIDWVQYANGNYRQELIERKKEMQRWFLKDIEPFLRYVHRGEVWYEFETQKYLHFDLERKCWTESADLSDDTNSLRAAYKWLHRFKSDEYFDFESVTDVAPDYQELYWIEPKQHLKAIKIELILSKVIIIDWLIEVKSDLELFWYKIQDLDHIEIEADVNEKLPKGFKFTWENILREFGLPAIHLNSLNPKESYGQETDQYGRLGSDGG